VRLPGDSVAGAGSPPRLLVISGFWPTRDNPINGQFVLQQAEAYGVRRYRVTVIAPQGIRGRRQRPYHARHQQIDVFSPVFLDVPQRVSGAGWAVGFNARSCAYVVARTVRRQRLGSTFDAVHLHGLRYAGLCLPWLDRCVQGPKTITLHGVDRFVEQRSSRPWLRALLSRVWQRVDYVTLVGSPLDPYASRLAAPAAKCKVVHNGTVLPPVWTAHQRPGTVARVVLSVSNLVPLKGIDLNLRALARLSATHPELKWAYRIVGDGPNRADLEALAQKLAIASQVTFLGRIDHAATMDEIASCDVFSLPSWGDSFGIVYLEAMARGRPVIGCSGCGAAESVRHGEQGLLVPPKNLEALTEALLSLLDEPTLASRLGTAGRKQAEQFGWTKNVARHLDLFEQARGSAWSS
jgi:glycosyltransferase involved in cell wall biosynthesis